MRNKSHSEGVKRHSQKKLLSALAIMLVLTTLSWSLPTYAAAETYKDGYYYTNTQYGQYNAPYYPYSTAYYNVMTKYDYSQYSVSSANSFITESAVMFHTDYWVGDPANPDLGNIYAMFMRIEISAKDPNGKTVTADRLRDVQGRTSPNPGEPKIGLLVYLRNLLGLWFPGTGLIPIELIYGYTSPNLAFNLDYTNNLAYAEWSFWRNPFAVSSLVDRALWLSLIFYPYGTVYGTYKINIHYQIGIERVSFGYERVKTVDLYDTFDYNYKQITPPQCPNLLVWDGNQFVDEGVLGIHNVNDPESDVVVNHTLATTPAVTDHHRYTLKLAEIGKGHNFSHSWIDQVKLYAVDEDGVWRKCPLISATHSTRGNVLRLLLLSDDQRTETFKGEEITLQFVAAGSRGIVQFVFVIEGHNYKPV